MPYPFMLSYARRDATRGRDPEPEPQFDAFVELLDERVSQITGQRGFVDRTDIQPGDEWPDALADALRAAQTLVCLYSPSYFLSDYCGKEMQVFLERRQNYMHTNAGKPPANIIAVAWQPIPRRVPKTLPDFQITNPNLDRDKKGVWDLGGPGQSAKLTNVAHHIADSVREAADLTPLPPLAERPRIHAVRSAFLPPPLPLPEFDSANTIEGPNAVTFVYASSIGWNAWPWAPPDEQAVLYLATSVAKGREMACTQLTFDPADANLAGRLDSLRRRNNVVILLVDAPTLSALRARIQDYDRRDHASFAVIVIDNNQVPELQARLNESLPYFARRAAPHFHVVQTRGTFSLESRESFSKRMAEALEQIKLAVLNNPHLPNVIGSGTDFHSLPAVNGPGRLA
jgi:TIR domain